MKTTVSRKTLVDVAGKLNEAKMPDGSDIVEEKISTDKKIGDDKLCQAFLDAVDVLSDEVAEQLPKEVLDVFNVLVEEERQAIVATQRAAAEVGEGKKGSKSKPATKKEPKSEIKPATKKENKKLEGEKGSNLPVKEKTAFGRVKDTMFGRMDELFAKGITEEKAVKTVAEEFDKAEDAVRGRFKLYLKDLKANLTVKLDYDEKKGIYKAALK